MGKYIKKFATHSQYESYINGSDAYLPNVSTCDDQPTHVHYNPYVEPVGVDKLTVTYDVITTEEDTALFDSYYGSSIVGVEIDGVELSTVQNTYRFNTIGEHTVKYTLHDPSSISANCFRPDGTALRITKYSIPEEITSIEYDALQTSLNSFDIVVYSNTPPEIAYSIGHESDINKIYVPAESVDIYKAEWSRFADKIVAIP